MYVYKGLNEKKFIRSLTSMCKIGKPLHRSERTQTLCPLRLNDAVFQITKHTVAWIYIRRAKITLFDAHDSWALEGRFSASCVTQDNNDKQSL
jgi:hypothetical protein